MVGSIFDEYTFDKNALALIQEVQFGNATANLDVLANSLGLTPVQVSGILKRFLRYNLLVKNGEDEFELNLDHELTQLLVLLSEYDRREEFLFVNEPVAKALKNIYNSFDCICYLLEEKKFVCSPQKEINSADNIPVVSIDISNLKKEALMKKYVILKGLKYLLIL